jgi:two-component system cell cycle response regulator
MQFNVLLIGKEPKQTETYAQLIRDLVECHIDVMSRAENALNWIARVRYHLVVMDIPNSSILLERIKRVHPESSVIVISDSASIEDAVKTIKLGAEDYLKKPLNYDSFRHAVRRGIDRKALFDEDGVYSRYLNLVNSCQMISASLEESRVLSIVKSYLSRELRSTHACMFILDNKIGPLLHESDHSVEGMHEVFEIALRNANLPENLVGELFYKFFDRTPTNPGTFAFRFHCVGDKEYYLVCLSPKKPDPMGEFESRLKILRAQIEVTGQNILRYKDVQAMAYVDDVTGLNNTRYLSTVLDREIEKANSSKLSFAVLFIDCDRFKMVNDQHGHLHGSKLLYQIGQKLKSHVRDTDTLARYGGDEFVAILSPAELDTGKSVAERIRKSIEKTCFLEDEGLSVRVTVSIGVAVFPDHAASKEEVLEAADKTMYEAKNQGRNCVYVSEGKKSDKKHRRVADRIPIKKDGTDG